MCATRRATSTHEPWYMMKYCSRATLHQSCHDNIKCCPSGRHPTSASHKTTELHLPVALMQSAGEAMLWDDRATWAGSHNRSATSTLGLRDITRDAQCHHHGNTLGCTCTQIMSEVQEVSMELTGNPYRRQGKEPGGSQPYHQDDWRLPLHNTRKN